MIRWIDRTSGPEVMKLFSCSTQMGERSISVVECLTRDRGAAGSSLTGPHCVVSLSKTHKS